MHRRIPRKPLIENIDKRPSKKKNPFDKNLLDSLDESPEFHDPYSDLNLFLSQKIKQQMNHCCNPNKWSVQLQEELIHNIKPEFQKRFPKYHLGVTALKKTWEKVQYYSMQIQEKKEALTQDGKLNLSFFIKENLKTLTKVQNTCHVHPCHYAHQLAAKMSECIAVVDGIRPKLEQLTRTIWSLQRHLIAKLSPEHFKSPYDENEKIDKLIVKSILEMTAKYPEISQAELAFHVQKQMTQLHSVVTTYSSSQLHNILQALIADQEQNTSGKMEKVLEKLPYPTARCIKNALSQQMIDSPLLPHEKILEHTVDFFKKVEEAFETGIEEEIERKIQNWTIQSEMLLRWVRLPSHSALLREVESSWQEHTDLNTIHARACARFLAKHPNLTPYTKEVELRSWLFLKYLWYTEAFSDETSTYDRFILWHKKRLEPERLSPQELIEKIEKTCKKMLPLLPFNRTRAQTILVTEEQQEA